MKPPRRQKNLPKFIILNTKPITLNANFIIILIPGENLKARHRRSCSACQVFAVQTQHIVAYNRHN